MNTLLVESPKQPPNANAEFKVNEHRQSKQILQATRQTSRTNLKPKKSAQHLATPDPPQISAAPLGRRRSPAPPLSQSNSSSGSLPTLNTGPIPQLPTSATLRPALSAASSSYSATNPEFSNLPSARSGMYRSRTPNSSSTPTVESPPSSARLPSTPHSPGPQRQGSPGPPLGARQSSSGSSTYYARERPDRERPPRSLRGSPVLRTGSPVPVPLPPRSLNRPGSSMGRPAITPRDGMF